MAEIPSYYSSDADAGIYNRIFPDTFKMLDENLALTGGDFGTRMLSLQILLTTRENTPPNYGMAQAQAVIFFILIAVVSIVQVIVTKRKEIEA